MKILVCVKQVADQESKAIVTEDNSWVTYGDKTSYWINRYDEHAVEAALLIKEEIPDTMVDVLTIGPERVKEVIRRAIGMGADRGFHYHYNSESYISPAVKSRLMADFCRREVYDLIITGVMSEDIMSAQTGPMLAAHLKIPSATSVVKVQIDSLSKNIRVERELDGGLKAELNLSTPALISVQSGINRPRYPSFSNIMRAKQAEIEEIGYSEHHEDDKYEKVYRVLEPQASRAALKLEGDITQKAQLLWQMLREKSLI